MNISDELWAMAPEARQAAVEAMGGSIRYVRQAGPENASGSVLHTMDSCMHITNPKHLGPTQ